MVLGLMTTNWSGLSLTGIITSQLLIAIGLGLFLVGRWYIRLIRTVSTIPTIPRASFFLGHIPLIKKMVDDGANPADGEFTWESVDFSDSNMILINDIV